MSVMSTLLFIFICKINFGKSAIKKCVSTFYKQKSPREEATN